MLNWLAQVVSISWFSVRTIPGRKGSALATVVGIAGVVAVFVGVFSMAEGFRQAMTNSSADDVALVMRGGADAEMSSTLSRDECRIITDAPGLARDASGSLASPEMFMIIDQNKRTTGTPANVPLRGVSPASFHTHDKINFVAGRPLTPGRNELNVGVAAVREFAGLDLGQKLQFGGSDWTVVGIFSAGGGISESEIWADAAVLQPAYHRDGEYQSVYAKLASPGAFDQFAATLKADPRLDVRVIRQTDFFAEESSVLTTFIKTIGVLVAVLMGLGALFGALNTMYGAVAARTREIATLRALGFGAGPVILSVMFESLVLALAGGLIGSLAAYWVFNGFTAATMNWQTFSQVAFAFRVTPSILVSAAVVSTIIGVLGGLFPAVHAARLPIATALRDI